MVGQSQGKYNFLIVIGCTLARTASGEGSLLEFSAVIANSFCQLGSSLNSECSLSYQVLAAKQGDLFAQRNLGFKYFSGGGIPEDTAEAVR